MEPFIIGLITGIAASFIAAVPVVRRRERRQRRRNLHENWNDFYLRMSLGRSR